MAKTKHAVCWKCGSSDRRIAPVKGCFDTFYKVRCPNCGNETDFFDGKKEAWETWDDMYAFVQKKAAAQNEEM